MYTHTRAVCRFLGVVWCDLRVTFATGLAHSYAIPKEDELVDVVSEAVFCEISLLGDDDYKDDGGESRASTAILSP